MVRTRDYFLLIITIAFLLIGIGATVADSYRQGGLFDVSRPLKFAEDADIERTAVVLEGNTETDRAARLAVLREKIAAGGLLSLSPTPTSVFVDTEATSSDESAEVVSEEQGVRLCTNYQAFAGIWLQNVSFEESEGARILYIESTKPSTAPATSTIETSPIYTPSRVVILELPMRSASMGMQNCIPLDVIGVALDGSLIKNSMASLYTAFGANTLIGYALDGYPIYGNDTAVTDSCGGLQRNGQYRYHISSERETIINCYSGVPVGL